MNKEIREYFEFGGKEYYYGTIVKFKTPQRYWITDGIHPQKAVDCMYGAYIGTDNNFALSETPDYKFGTYNRAYLKTVPTSEIAQIVKAHDPDINSYVKVCGDLEDTDMIYAWITYIFVMLVASIFHGNFVLWIIFSIIFFSYRHDKLYVKKHQYDRMKNNYRF